MKNIYYWSPCLSKVGTYKSTINSAISLAKLSNKFSVKVINVCGEWKSEKQIFEKNNVELINLGFNYFSFLPKTGFIKSRISYLIIILISFIPLIMLIKKRKPDYLIIHLITSLPIFLSKFFKSQTRFVLRISGYPKLTIIRQMWWKYFSNYIYFVTSPSKDLVNQLHQKNIFKKEIIKFLPDPIIDIKRFLRKKNETMNIFVPTKKNFFISVGRLTKQKNFQYLINEFNEFIKLNNDYDLLIFGEGEDKKVLNQLIKKYGLKNRIFLMGFNDNVDKYLEKAEAFILSSLWEDPGFVLIEAAMSNLFIVSSNCKNGPIEFLNNGKGGILFETNQKEALINSLKEYISLTEKKKFSMKIEAKKNCYKYTSFRHSNIFQKILI